MEEAGKEDRSIALKHTSTIKSLANVEKRSRGQLKGLRRAKIVAGRAEQERKLQEFIDADSVRKQKFGYVLPSIASVYQQMADEAEFEMNLNGLERSSKTLGTALMIYDLANERIKPDLDREARFMDRNLNRSVQRLMISLRNFDLNTDRTITREMLRRLLPIQKARNLPALKQALQSEDSIDRFLNDSFTRSRLKRFRFREVLPFQVASGTEKARRPGHANGG